MAGPEAQPEAAPNKPDATKIMGEFFKPKAEGMSGGAEKKEAPKEKALRMLTDKLNTAARQVKRNFEKAGKSNPSKDEIWQNLESVSRDYVNGLLKDPNFPGLEHLETGYAEQAKPDKDIIAVGGDYVYLIGRYSQRKKGITFDRMTEAAR